jgi:hypothetical protein
MPPDYSDVPNDTEEEETVIEQPEPAAEPEPAPKPAAKRRPPQVSHRAPVETHILEGDPKQVDMDVSDRWPAVIDWVQKRYGLGPETIRIKVYGVALGPYAGVGEESLGEIPGDCVSGDEQRSPGATLRDWVIDAYHMVRKGPMKYRFRFMHRTKPQGATDYQICVGELVLASPEVVAQQRRAEIEAYNRAHRAGSVAMPAAPVGMGAMPQQPLAQGVPQPLMLPPAPASGQTMTEELFREMFQRVLRGEPLGAVPAAAPPSPPPPTIEQELQRFAMIKKLFDAPPAPPPPPPPKVPTLEEQFENVTRMIGMMQKLMPQPAQVQQASVALTKPPSPLENMKELIGFLKQVDETKEALGMGGGPDDDDKPEDEPLPYKVSTLPGTEIKYPHGENLSTAEQAKLFVALNPDLSFKMIGKVADILDKSTIGQIVHQMIQRGNPGQVAVAKQAVQAGLAAVPQASNGALSPPAPTIPSPPPAAPDPGWTPPV